MHKNVYKIIESLTEPILLVVDDIVKRDILSHLNGKLYNITFISLHELINKLSFTYNEEAIYMVMKEYHVNYEIAITYLNNLTILNYINDKIENEKITLLKSIYQFLDINKLLIKDNLFIKYCQKKKIIIYGYPFLSKEDLYLLNNIDYTYIPIKYDNQLNAQVLSCNTFKDELFYAIETICQLITNKVSLSDIKLVGISEEQYFYTKQVFKMYQIPLSLNEKKSLYSYDITKKILKDLQHNSLEFDDENPISSEVIKVINKYARFTFDDILINCLQQCLKHTYVIDKINNDAIEAIDINSLLYLENKYVFIFGFNQGKIPINYKDEDFFSDEFKTSFNLTTTKDLNQRSHEIILKALATNNHINISYTLEESPSPIINALDLSIEEMSSTYYSKYSSKYNEYLLVSYLDNYLKYGTKSEALHDLVKTYPIPFLTYDNSFTGISKDINKKLILSYTAIDNYYKCSFMYYIKRVLKLDMFEDNFTTFIGNLYHKILSVAFTDNFDFEAEYNLFIQSSQYQLNNKELYLLIKLKTELINIINILSEQAQYITYSQVLYEQNIETKLNNPVYPDYDITFVGYIDKIWYKTITDEAGKEITYISIVDYKTGKLDIKLDLVPYGLSLQLPVYLYLASHSNLVNVQVYGFFLQNIIQNELKARTEEEYLTLKKDALKLSGYIVDSVPVDAEFDQSKRDSKIIKSLKMKNDGSYYARSKVLTKDKINDLINIVENKILKASSDIISGKFPINPKINKGANLSCRYCRFNDLCYKTYQDHIHLEVGDDDDQMD